MTNFWNGLSLEEWSKESERRQTAFLAGESTIKIPGSFFRLPTEFGVFIEIQPQCLLDREPGVFVRDCHYGAALKVLCPKELKAGDTIRITKKSASGKSYHARIEVPA